MKTLVNNNHLESRLDNDTFSKVMDNLVCESSDLDGVVSFSGKYDRYEVNFYGLVRDGFSLEVDLSGYEDNGWNHLVFTKNQLAQMQSKIDALVVQLELEKQEPWDVAKEQGYYSGVLNQ